MILNALPSVGLEGRRSGNALRREIGQGSVVRLMVVHEDLALSTDAEVLSSRLGRVGHGDEGDVGVGNGLGGLTRCQCRLFQDRVEESPLTSTP